MVHKGRVITTANHVTFRPGLKGGGGRNNNKKNFPLCVRKGKKMNIHENIEKMIQLLENGDMDKAKDLFLKIKNSNNDEEKYLLAENYCN